MRPCRSAGRGRRPGSRSSPGARAATGFTLIELVAVLALVGLLATAARPMLALHVRRAQEAELRQALRTLRGALDAYHDAALAGRLQLPPGASPWPPTLQVLVDGVPLAADPARRLHLLRRLPRDPMADGAAPATAAGAWALRASDSPPDDPRPGADVFDIASRSTGRALDGSRYRDW